MNAPANIPATLAPFGVPLPRYLTPWMVYPLHAYNRAWAAEEEAGDDHPKIDDLVEVRCRAFDALMEAHGDTAEIAIFKLAAITQRYQAGVIQPEQLQPVFDDLARLAALPKARTNLDISSPFAIAMAIYKRADDDLFAYDTGHHDASIALAEKAKSDFEQGLITAVERAVIDDAMAMAQRCYDVLCAAQRAALDMLIIVEVNTIDELHCKLIEMEKVAKDSDYSHTFSDGFLIQLANDVAAIGLNQ